MRAARSIVVATIMISAVILAGPATAKPGAPLAENDRDSPSELTADFRIQLLDEAKGDISVSPEGTIEQTIDGQTLIMEQDGDWSIDGGPTEPSGGEVTPMFSVYGCVGSFADVYKVNGYIQFGASQTCSDSRSYPHWIKYQLRSGSTAPFARFRNETNVLRSPYSYDYNRVTSVVGILVCSSSTTRRYQQIVWPAAKGIEFGPYVDSDEFRVACTV